MKKISLGLVAALVLVASFAYAAPTVKNYFTGCSGFQCDNVLNIGGTLTFKNRGTVTQITTIATGVTINATSGTITTVSQTTAGGAEVTFVVTNSKVAATDTIALSVVNAGAGVSSQPRVTLRPVLFPSRSRTWTRRRETVSSASTSPFSNRLPAHNAYRNGRNRRGTVVGAQ
jgi:hypothetical protein